MAYTPPGQAIRRKLRTPRAIKRLRAFVKGAKSRGDLRTWRRGKAVLDYIEGKAVIEMAESLDVTRGSINRWLELYNARGIDGLRTRKPPGRPPTLSTRQRTQLAKAIDRGPQTAGFTSGVWTGPMIGELIRRRFGVKYHNHHVPRLLHQLGFSVQRPRKRLARADREAQEYWLRKKLPSIKKSREMPRCRPLRRRGELLARRDAPLHVGARRQTTSC